MSYSIVFETKFMKLSDGRIVHFSRSGCNNDDSGRKKNEFEAKILTEDEFIKIYEKYHNMESDDEFVLKVSNRWVSFKGYAEHLMRMYKRALSFDDFIKKFRLTAECLIGIEVTEPFKKMMSPDQFDKEYYDIMKLNGHIRYKRCIDYLPMGSEKTLLETIQISKTVPVQFEIMKVHY